MITIEQYFQAKPHTKQQEVVVLDLLERRQALRDEFYAATGLPVRVCPNTGTEISGSKGGQGDGGFRLDTATTGGGHSSHKILYVQQPDGSWKLDPENALPGVDDYDPHNEFDDWITTFEGEDGANSKLEEHGLYREHPDSTEGWCHLTTRAPHSGRRTFKP